jgi:hypothetical protein
LSQRKLSRWTSRHAFERKAVREILALWRCEWLLIDFIVLGILLWQLVSVRRAIRKDREASKDRE